MPPVGKKQPRPNSRPMFDASVNLPGLRLRNQVVQEDVRCCEPRCEFRRYFRALCNPPRAICNPSGASRKPPLCNFSQDQYFRFACFPAWLLP
jgi:hypothetical protein